MALAEDEGRGFVRKGTASRAEAIAVTSPLEGDAWPDALTGAETAAGSSVAATTEDAGAAPAAWARRVCPANGRHANTSTTTRTAPNAAMPATTFAAERKDVGGATEKV